MKSKILKYSEFVNEMLINENETETKPMTKPGISEPKTKPRRPSPFKRTKVKPKPKASIDDVVNKFQDEISDIDKKKLIDKYENS